MTTWTAADIPDQSGKTAVVTGAGSGIGFHTAAELCRAGARVVVAARDEARGAAAVRALRERAPRAEVEQVRLDLAELRGVRRCAEEIRERWPVVDILVNNAGVMDVPQRLTTADGFELQFGVNHLGHFALTGLLLSALLARPGARVVTVSSLAHARGRIRFDDLQSAQRYGSSAAYSQSKLANLLFAIELDRRARSRGVSLVSAAAHPGVAATNLTVAGPALGHPDLRLRLRLFAVRRIAQPAARGALPILYAATAPDVVGGGYYGPDGPGQLRGGPTRVPPAPAARDEVTARRLWEVSEELTGVDFSALDARA